MSKKYTPVSVMTIQSRVTAEGDRDSQGKLEKLAECGETLQDSLKMHSK